MKTIEELKEARRQYYLRNRVRICRYRLHEGYLKSIQRDKNKAFYKAKLLTEKFPYDEYMTLFKKAADKYGVYDGAYGRQECEEAAIAAYMYSIYRCAAQGYEHVDRYIKKMIYIYVLCASVVASDEMNRSSWDEDFERYTHRYNFD